MLCVSDLVLYILLLSSLIIAQDSGPTASVSIASEPAYVTARPCAATCLWYNGIFVCGVHSGYSDLATNLECSCDATNSCYCGKDNAAFASSYISSCVSAGCSSFPTEIANMITLYDSYCATAQVVATTTSATLRATSTTAASLGSTPAESGRAETTTSGNVAQATGGSVIPTQTTSSDESGKKGLTQSDVIALGVGLGVGVPSLLLALATFCLQRKKKEKERRVSQAIANASK
jgi:hypothetical protein